LKHIDPKYLCLRLNLQTLSDVYLKARKNGQKLADSNNFCIGSKLQPQPSTQLPRHLTQVQLPLLLHQPLQLQLSTPKPETLTPMQELSTQKQVHLTPMLLHSLDLPPLLAPARVHSCQRVRASSKRTLQFLSKTSTMRTRVCPNNRRAAASQTTASPHHNTKTKASMLIITNNNSHTETSNQHLSSTKGNTTTRDITTTSSNHNPSQLPSPTIQCRTMLQATTNSRFLIRSHTSNNTKTPTPDNIRRKTNGMNGCLMHMLRPEMRCPSTRSRIFSSQRLQSQCHKLKQLQRLNSKSVLECSIHPALHSLHLLLVSQVLCQFRR